MTIGLVRHFKVNHPYPKKFLLSRAEVVQWFEEYATAGLDFQNIDISPEEWESCYSSSMDRAMKTAGHIYRGHITSTDDLKELDILHLLPSKIKLPFLVWAVMVRIRCMSKDGDICEFNDRIARFAEKIIAEKRNVLVVSHWFVMKVLEKELKAKGFQGEKIRSGQYGKLYRFEHRP